MSKVDELSSLIEEAGLKVSFDMHRNITLCCLCGAKAETGQSFKAKAPGWEDRACRRLCETCEGKTPSVSKIVEREKHEMFLRLCERLTELSDENSALKKMGEDYAAHTADWLESLVIGTLRAGTLEKVADLIRFSSKAPAAITAKEMIESFGADRLHFFKLLEKCADVFNAISSTADIETIKNLSANGSTLVADVLKKHK